MERLKPYNDLTERERWQLDPSIDKIGTPLGLPLKVWHPIHKLRSKILPFSHSVEGSDGIQYLFFDPHERVRGMPHMPCGLHIKRPWENGVHVPYVVLKADFLVVDMLRREVLIEDDAKQLQALEFQKLL